MKNISFCDVEFEGGFWKSRYDLNAEVSLQSVYKRFEESDRFNGLRFKEGAKVDLFYDSDVAKWIEAVSYLIEKRGGYEEELTVNQFADLTMKNEKTELTMKADFARDGKVELKLKNNRYKKIFIRKPIWCEACVTTGKTEGDYIVFEGIGETFSTDIDFCMKPYFAECNPQVRDNCGRVALCYGPTVYCLEGADNPWPLNSLRVKTDSRIEKAVLADEGHFYALIAEGMRDLLFDGLYRKAEDRREKVQLKFRPYWTFANREVCDMAVWIRRD